MLCLILAVFDQITKEAIIDAIPKYSRKTVIPGFFDLTYVTNPGAAWGIMEGKGILLLTISMSFVTVGVSATMLYFLLYPESLEILTTGSSEAAMASFAMAKSLTFYPFTLAISPGLSGHLSMLPIQLSV